MKRLILVWLLVTLGPWLRASESVTPDAESSRARDLENKVAALISGPQITVVHFWAPWCPNCKAELTPDGWAKFVRGNPAVKIVFINIWHEGQDGTAKLKLAGLGAQPNFVAFVHPNPARKSGERLEGFLGLPISWIPTTWIFKDGKLRYALNYGEMRFTMLQQMVRDSAESWDR